MALSTDQFDSFVEDLLGEKLPRTLIIIGASKIDDLLIRIIEKYLLPARNLKEDELLKSDFPLSTLSARIKIVYRLGIINNEIFILLDRIRKIRNLCAHNIEFNLKKSPVRDYISEIKTELTGRNSFKMTKSRFFSDQFDETKELQCHLVTLCVILEAILAKITKTKGIRSTLTISTK